MPPLRAEAEAAGAGAFFGVAEALLDLAPVVPDMLSSIIEGWRGFFFLPDRRGGGGVILLACPL